jgi:hypothetical protein
LLGTESRIAYNVYEVAPQVSGGSPEEGSTRLTATPVADERFVDERVEWGRTRCYAIGTVEIIDGLPVEGDRGASRCVTLVDTFPPAAPKKPTAIGLVGAISVLWDANEEKDLAGYIVLRGAPGEPLEPITPEPIDRTSFTDAVQTGHSAVYAVEAVDKAGNVSPMSPVSDEEKAR